MKILLLSNNAFTEFGGYEKVIKIVFSNLKERYGCEFEIFSLLHYKSHLNNVVIDEFKTYSIIWDSQYKNKLSYVILTLFKRLFRLQLNINLKIYKKYENTIVNSDIIIVTDCLLLNSLQNYLKKNNICKKVVFWDHGSLQGYLRSWHTRFFYNNEIKKAILKTKYHLAIATEIKEIITSINKNAEVFVVFNPIDPYDEHFIKLTDKNVFLFVGRLTDKHKNLKFLFRGLSKLPTNDWRLHIIGKGPDEQKLKKYAYKLGIANNIEWLGFKTEPFLCINEAKILILTSRWEGFPLVLVEANQHGLPVLSSDCKTGPKDIVKNYENGLLYKEGDMNDFLRKLKDIYNNKICFASQKVIINNSKKYEINNYIDNLHKILMKIVSE